MSAFNEYFRAEILSKALLSGPAGRVMAITLTALWGISAVIRSSFGLVSKIWQPNDHSQAVSEAFARIKSAAKGFGDAFSVESPPPFSGGTGWKFAKIRGTGWRTGEFELAFLCHAPSGSVRAFIRRQRPDLAGELKADEIAEILGAPPGTFSPKDAVTLYATIRQRYL